MISVLAALDLGGANKRLKQATDGVAKALLVGAGASLALHKQDLFARIRSTQFSTIPHKFEARTWRLLAGISRFTRRPRSRAHFEKDDAGQTVVATRIGRERADSVVALETGGTYEQFVPYPSGHDITRRVPRRKRKGAAEPRAKTPSGSYKQKGYTRMRKERGFHLFAQSSAAMQPKNTIPVQRAIDTLLTQHRLASRGELLSGLR